MEDKNSTGLFNRNGEYTERELSLVETNKVLVISNKSMYVLNTEEAEMVEVKLKTGDK